MDILSQLILFAGGMVIVTIALFLWSWFELKSFEKALAHWKKGKHMNDIFPIIYIPIIGMLLLTIFLPVSVEASEFKYLQWAQVDVGLQYQLGDVPFELNGTYRHHSCALGDDTQVYDAVGFQAGWRFNSPWSK